MLLSRRWFRRIFTLVLVLGLFAAVTYYIVQDSRKTQRSIYQERSTLAVQTAIAARLFELTRTAEANLPQYRLVKVEADEPLIDVANQYNTTLEVLRVANSLLPTVDFGDGSIIIVPEGVQTLDPPRSFATYTVQPGETLQLLADRFEVTLEQLQIDNPTLAQRPLVPGDVVFVPHNLK